MKLLQLLTSRDLGLTQAHFSWDVSQVEVSRIPIDGPGRISGQSSSSILRASHAIRLDSSDVPQRADGTLDLDTEPRDRQTLYHELIHLDQQKRGFWYRLKMWYWRRRYDYATRPHEQEAHDLAQQWMAEDRAGN